MKKQVIRIGDTVRIVNPLAVRRVGYPLVWYDLVDEVKADPKVRQAYRLLTGKPDPAVPVKKFEFLSVEDLELPSYFVKACAMLRVEQRNFGGNERTLHYYRPVPQGECFITDTYTPDMTGYVSEVVGKRVVKTGRRFPPSQGTSDTYYGEEYWDIPGGLDDEKTHVLLTVGGYEYEQCNVELVKRK